MKKKKIYIILILWNLKFKKENIAIVLNKNDLYLFTGNKSTTNVFTYQSI